MSSSLQPGFPCFESRCPRHSNPYHSLAGLQNHLESVLTHFADRQTKRGDEARCHNVNRVLQELKLNCTPDIITQQNEQGEVVGNWIHEAVEWVGEEDADHMDEDEGVEWVGEEDADYMEEDEEEEEEEAEYEEDEENGEDEVGEATSQPVLRVPEAPNGSASRQHTQNRWTSNRGHYDHRDAFHIPNETIHMSQGLTRNTPI